MYGYSLGRVPAKRPLVRFVVGLLLCLVIVLFTMIVSVSDYQIQKEVCEAEARQAGGNALLLGMV